MALIRKCGSRLCFHIQSIATRLRVKRDPEAAIVGKTRVEPGDDRRTKRPPGNVCRWTSLYVIGYNVSMQNDAIPDAAPIQGSAAVPGGLAIAAPAISPRSNAPEWIGTELRRNGLTTTALNAATAS